LLPVQLQCSYEHCDRNGQQRQIDGRHRDKRCGERQPCEGQQKDSDKGRIKKRQNPAAARRVDRFLNQALFFEIVKRRPVVPQERSAGVETYEIRFVGAARWIVVTSDAPPAGHNHGAHRQPKAKRQRRDSLSRRLASRVFNKVTSWLTGVSMHDMNCGFKAYRGDCARSLDLYGELHRYVPVLAVQQGWRVSELPVNHRARRHGSSRFGTERYLRGALDLLTVVFIGRYQYRPLHLFGGVGFAVTAVGVMIGIYLTILKVSGEAIGQRPLLFLGILLIVVGIQLLTFGLLAQMTVLSRQDHQASRLAAARIERLVGFADPMPNRAAGRQQ